MKLILTLILCLLPVLAFGAGTITSLDVAAAGHGDTVVISGSGFGTKSPAAPLWWDSMKDATADTPATLTTGDISSVESTLATGSKHYSERWPRSGTSDTDSYAMYHTAGTFRSVAAPHGNTNRFIAGRHFQTTGNTPPYSGTGAEDYYDVMVTVDSGVTTNSRLYASMYYRLDPSYKASCPYNLNHKFTTVQSGPYAYSSGASGTNSYINYRGAQSPECPATSGGVTGAQLQPPSSAGSCVYGNFTVANYPITANPINDWIKVEDIMVSTSDLGFRNVWINNVHGLATQNNCGDWFPNKFRSWTAGGYWRWAEPTGAAVADNSTYRGCDTCYRYFSDIYVDTTLKRVMLCNANTYAASTVCEPQIPSAWADGQITIKVNTGRLGLQTTAYLYVFDDENASSAASTGLTIGDTSGTDVTAPTVTGFTIPSTSTTLNVSITTFTATDAVGVTGYCITTTNSAPALTSDCWTAVAPTTYAVSAAGSYTLYGWAKDAAGNRSTSSNDSVTVSLPARNGTLTLGTGKNGKLTIRLR